MRRYDHDPLRTQRCAMGRRISKKEAPFFLASLAALVKAAFSLAASVITASKRSPDALKSLTSNSGKSLPQQRRSRPITLRPKFRASGEPEWP